MTDLYLRVGLFFLIIAAPSHPFSLCANEESVSARIFYNGKVFTAEPDHPYAEAVAIQDEKIVAVGTLLEVSKSVPANAALVDLKGKSLFPGFVDSHSHSIDGGIAG